MHLGETLRGGGPVSQIPVPWSILEAGGLGQRLLGAYKDDAVCRHISFPRDSYGGGGLPPCHFMSSQQHNEC